MLAEFITEILFLIAVIDPLGSVPVYLEATKELEAAHKRKVAINATLVAYGVLLFFILLGQYILDGMAITLDAFQISGGLILFLFSLTMIFGEGKPASEKKIISDYRHVTMFPVAIPSIASPGAIMAVVLLTDNSVYSFKEQSFTALLVLIVLLMTMLLLLGASVVQKRIGDYGIVIISKIMGLILASYAIQSILSGVNAFFGLV
jgi:multiple antibiotic resistance protein